MNIYIANLKHLYQNRGIWLFYLFILVFPVLAVAGLVSGENFFITGPSIWLWLCGMFLGIIQVENLSMPFMFCMPGHRQVPGRLIFIIGFILLAILLTVHLSFCGLGVVGSVVGLLSVGSVYWMSFLLGVFLSYYFRNAGLIGFCAVGQLLDSVTDNSFYIDCMPYWYITLAVVLTVLIWKYINDGIVLRKICGSPVAIFSYMGKRQMADAKRRQLSRIDSEKENGMLSVQVERFFISRIESASSWFSRCLWGNIYRAMAIYFSQFKNLPFWLLTVLLTVWLGLFGPMANLLFLMPIFIAAQIDLSVFGHNIFAGGRKERYYSAVVISVCFAVLSAVLALYMAGVSYVVELYMPSFMIGEIPVSYKCADIRFAVFLLLLPIGYIMNLLTTTLATRMMLIMFTGMFFGVAALMINIMQFRIESAVLCLWVLVLAVVLWPVFLLLLKRVCRRRELII